MQDLPEAMHALQDLKAQKIKTLQLLFHGPQHDPDTTGFSHIESMALIGPNDRR